jgi:hypothetical protein
MKALTVSGCFATAAFPNWRMFPTMTKTSNRSLRLTPYAWAKLLFLRDLGNTEVGGFGISAPDDLLLVEDICLIKQSCTEVTVRFDDQAVADFFDTQVDAGLAPRRFARIWVHTHPGKSSHPSRTDERTFQRCFGGSDWALMFILARGGQTYARLRINAGPGGELELPVKVDFTLGFPAAAHVAWEQEYRQAVQEDQYLPLLPSKRPTLGFPRHEGLEGPALEYDPYLDDPYWDDAPLHPLLETVEDGTRHPF